MIEEQIDIVNNNSKGTLDIIYHDGLELIYDKEPLLISWDGDGQYSWHYAFMNELETSKSNIFKSFEESISNKGLANSNDEISNLLSSFVSGNYTITKFKSPIKESGKYFRLADYSIEIAKTKTEKIKESEVEQNFRSYFTEQYQRNNSVYTIMNWTTDCFPTLQDPIIALKSKVDIDNLKIEKFKNNIQRGIFPYCLILSNFAENEDSLNTYCLGSIEIILAYNQLKIKPRFVEIKKINDESLRLNDNLIQELNTSLYSWQLNSIFDRYFNQENEIKRIKNLIEHPFKFFIKDGESKDYWPNKVIKSEGYYDNNLPNGIVTNYYPNGKSESIWFHNEKGERIRPIKQYFPTGELRSEFIYKEGDTYGISKLYRMNGTLQREMYFLEGVNYIMLNGKYYIKDGRSEIIYHENGKEEYVGYYKDGQKVDWKKYDKKGNLISQMNNSA